MSKILLTKEQKKLRKERIAYGKKLRKAEEPELNALQKFAAVVLGFAVSNKINKKQ